MKYRRFYFPDNVWIPFAGPIFNDTS